MTCTSDSDKATSPRSGPKPRSLRHSALTLFWTLCIVFTCAATGLAEKAPTLQVGGPAADVIFRCYSPGNPPRRCVVTVDQDNAPEVEALAVAEGKILQVGDLESVMKTYWKGTTEIVELGGTQTLMPGFVEPHTHVMQTAFDIHLITNLSSFTVPMNPGTIEQTQQRLREALNKVPKGGWLTAFGVDPSRASPFMASLNAEKLDEVSRTVPIFVINQSGHIAYVNHKAIDLAGITPETRNPAGGVYVRVDGKETGVLTGELQEGPAFAAFQKKLTNPPKDEDWLRALKKTYESFAAAGVTTATEMTLGAVTTSISGELKLLEEMAKSQSQLRIRAYVFADVIPSIQSLKINPNYGESDLFKVIGIKFIADGSTQGLSAALKEPYGYPTHTKNNGILNYGDGPEGSAKLASAARPYLEAGWQLAIHSNGDRTTDQVLSVYRELKRTASDGHSPADLRCRIEHLTVTEESQLQLIKDLGLTPSMTIGHVYFWGYAFDKENILGSTRAQRIDPAGSLIKKGIRFSFNSDSPITPVAPLRYISNAVTRLTLSGPEQAQVKLFSKTDDQRITIDEAIRAVTLDAAYQLFLDDQIGSLKNGKQADLVILKQNPRTMTENPEDIMKIEVLSTFLAGVRKYSAPK
jgi:predicted amidohydrolase YtcJ